ncbi:hypothetical protein JHK87_001124 [Glycine soja]|nr:hypothetical protein JHK87_001124 [Glycine soja]
MIEEQMVATVTQFHEPQKKKVEEEEEEVVVVMKENPTSVQAEAFAKAEDDTIVHEDIIDLTNIGNALDPASKQSTTLNEATSRDKGEPNVIIIYFTNSSPTPLNYA